MKQPKFKGWLVVAIVSLWLTISFTIGAFYVGGKSFANMIENGEFETWYVDAGLGDLDDNFIDDFMDDCKLTIDGDNTAYYWNDQGFFEQLADDFLENFGINTDEYEGQSISIEC